MRSIILSENKNKGTAITMNNQNTEQILNKIKSHITLLDGRGKTTAVFPIIKDILQLSIADAAVNTRLPPIRAIAETLNLTPVPVQRAINGLVKDGILYSKSKSGVFVQDRSTHSKTESTQHIPVFNNDFHTRIIFATESHWPCQRLFWSDISAGFTRGTPNNLVDVIHFVHDKNEPDKFDILEITQWDKHLPDWGDQFIDMRDLDLGYDSSFKHQTKPYWLPLYYRTHFLFYNQTILRKHGIPSPDYADLDGQLQYCEMTNTIAAKYGFTPKPQMVFYPITILGHVAKMFQRRLLTPDDHNALRELKTAIEKVRFFYERTSFSSNDDVEELCHRTFITGANPFYWGGSVDYWKFSNCNLDFDWRIYPYFNVDGELYKTPVYGVIRRNTAKPIECFRFLEFLLSPEIQKKFVATGVLSGDDSLNHMPKFAGNETLLQQILQQSIPVDFKHGDEFYLENNILNAELWRAAIGEVSWDKALDNAFKYGQYYIRRNAGISGN